MSIVGIKNIHKSHSESQIFWDYKITQKQWKKLRTPAIYRNTTLSRHIKAFFQSTKIFFDWSRPLQRQGNVY